MPIARAPVRALAASKIREIVNEGLGKPDVLPFWVGEPDQPTPDFIRRAGIDSIAAGETYYSHNLGIPELREALAAYLTRLHRPTAPGEVAATSAGVNALMLASQLLEALAPGTRALYLNSPNNPTGWSATRDEQRAILDHCRLGWLVVPATLAADLAKLIEYNTSCAPVFVQRAGVAALTEGEPQVARSLERLRRARDFLLAGLASVSGVSAAVPDGAMYAFLRVEGVADSLEFCKRLVRETGLGLAPGAAFGAEGEGFVRWCFAASEARLADGVARLRKSLG